MRVPIVAAANYTAAKEIKQGLVEKFPDRVFQIRKREHDFQVVERTWPGKTNGHKNRKDKKNGTTE